MDVCRAINCPRYNARNSCIRYIHPSRCHVYKAAPQNIKLECGRHNLEGNLTPEEIWELEMFNLGYLESLKSKEGYRAAILKTLIQNPEEFLRRFRLVYKLSLTNGDDHDVWMLYEALCKIFEVPVRDEDANTFELLDNPVDNRK